MTFLIALAVLIWLPVEDQDPLNSLLAATFICLVIGAHLWHRTGVDPCRKLWIRFPAGALALGALAPILAGVLMSFKSGLHSHGFPDFQFEDYLEVLRTIPSYLLVGFVTGIVGGAYRWLDCRSDGSGLYKPEPGR
ncbi:MAG TPA: hypothetical protein VJ768_04725 [Anaerolineales bacterium]|nr:hypothetical protein [Anaerolineales bacterium]